MKGLDEASVNGFNLCFMFDACNVSFPLSFYLYKRNPGSPGDSKKLQFALFSRRLFSRIPLDSAVALRISFVYIHMRLLRQSGAVKSRSCPLARSRMGPTPRNTDHCEG